MGDDQLNLTVVEIQPAWLYCLDRQYINNTMGGVGFLYFRMTLDIFLTISVLAINISLIVAVILYRRSYRGSIKLSNSKATIRFVGTLAVSDILVGLSVPWYLVPHYFCDVNEYYRKSEILCMMKYVPTCFASVMSNFSLIAIAADRYIAIVHPMKYRIILTDRVCNMAIAATFLSSLALSSVLFFWNYYHPGTYCDLEDVVPHGYVITLGSIFHTAILVIVGGIHYRLHQQASNFNSQRSVLEGNHIHAETRSNAKSARIVGLVTGVYFICWTPYVVFLIIRVLTKSMSPALDLGFQLTFPLSFANSALNPFIYAWKNGEIRAALTWFVQKLATRFQRIS